MTITVSSKWQMVIPSVIRKKYNIKRQSKVEVIDKGKEIVIIPLPLDSIKSARGVLKGVSSGEFVKSRRLDKKIEERKYRNYGLPS